MVLVQFEQREANEAGGRREEEERKEVSSKVRKKQYMLLVHICGAYLFKCACSCTYSLSVSERMVFVALEDLWFQALLLLFLLVVSDAKRPAQYSEKGMKEKEKEKGEGEKKKKERTKGDK